MTGIVDRNARWLTLSFLLLFLAAGALHAQQHTDREGTARYYPMTTIPEPDGAVLEVGGLAMLPDGRLAAATRRGDIWLIGNPSLGGGKAPYYKRFARGLFEPLGLVYRNGSLYTSQRGELTRLTDTTGDDRADLFERVYAWPLSGHYHEYTFGPASLPDGSMVVTANVAFGSPRWWEAESRVPWRGWTMRITPGGEMEPLAAGLRSPAGIAVNDRGDILYTENEGDWIGSGFLAHVERGDFFGNPAGLRWADRPESPVQVRPEQIVDSDRPYFETAERVPGVKLPAVWIPHTVMGISTSDILQATDNSFGPWEGHYFIGDQGHARINRVVMERVEGVYQGAVFPFRGGFASGVLRMAWGEPGSMYVGLTDRGWTSTGERGYGLQRLEWNGELPFEMREVRAQPDGFEIEFTRPVDREIAANPAHYSVISFTYMYRYDYGSPVIDRERAVVRGVRLSEDGRTVRLAVDRIRERYIHEIRLGTLRSADGSPLLHDLGYYTLNHIPEGELLAESEMTAVYDPQRHDRDRVAGAVEEIEEMSVETPGAIAARRAVKRVTQMPESWTDGPDRTIRLGTRPGLRFDIERIEVEAGSRIALTFDNDDTMLHNVVIVRPGTADEVGEMAMNLGLDGDALEYVPNTDDVLFFTSMLQPGAVETIYFRAPESPGTYTYVCTFPGHHIIMRGELVVR